MREGFGWGDVVEGKSGRFRLESEADALGHGYILGEGFGLPEIQR